VNIEKLVKEFVKHAIVSLEEDARHHERKASDARSTARLIKELQPEILNAFRPVKFKPPTKAQLKRMRAAAAPFVSAPPVARVG
jgi:hypothetical protein